MSNIGENDGEKWVTIKGGRRGHARCLRAYNGAIMSGTGDWDCGNSACCFSERYVRPAAPPVPPAVAAALARQDAADDAGEEKAARELGQE
jgi:hypothetical protein